MVAALENVMSDKSNVRVFNIGSGEGRSVLQIIASIEKLLNTRLRINWSVGRRIDVPKPLLSIERAKAVLRWKPETSFEKGLQKTFDWWKSRTEGCWRFMKFE